MGCRLGTSPSARPRQSMGKQSDSSANCQAPEANAFRTAVSFIPFLWFVGVHPPSSPQEFLLLKNIYFIMDVLPTCRAVHLVHA